MHLENQRPPRPMTHDLIVSILREVQVQVERVRISDMQGNTYYAMLELRDGDDTASIDCRPSDAIAVALRARASIYIDEDLLDRLDEQRKDSGIELSPGTMVVEPGEPTVH